MKTKDFIHLTWIYQRMINVHKENPNCDYMIKFRQMLEKHGEDEGSSGDNTPFDVKDYNGGHIFSHWKNDY